MTATQTSIDGLNKTPELVGVFASDLINVWKDVKVLIERALEFNDGKSDIEDIKRGIETRRMQLWVAYRYGKITTCMVTQIQCHPKEKRLMLFLYAGESIHEMEHFRPIVYDWAKKQGCKSLELYGRPGWEKALKNYGYEKIHTVLRCRI